MIYVSGGPRHLYLAYGSNLNVEQMKLRCPGAVPVGRVTVPDRRLVFRGWGSGSYYLTLDTAPGESVECIAWRINRAQERALDRYEGYPHLYLKEKARLPLRSLEGEPQGLADCMWYVMLESFPLGAPSQQYTRDCVAGYQHFGLPLDALKKALYDSLTPAGAGVAITLGFPREEWD